MSATKGRTRSAAVGQARCGKWMPRAGAVCGRKPDHAGKCTTARALKQQVDNRPRKTTRKRGVRSASDPAVRSRWNRAHRFVRLGITEAAFDAMLAAQGNACAMCRRPFGPHERICADHDHRCCPKQVKASARTCGKCIRGLLCFRCNTALGYVELFREMADQYLTRYAVSRAAPSQGKAPADVSAGALCVGDTGIEPVAFSV
jgi:hypothetical protein